MRAEEIIAEIWKQIGEIRARNGRPGRVVLSPDCYQLVQQYRAGLGDLANPALDYISRYEVFGLPVYIDPSVPAIVEEEPVI